MGHIPLVDVRVDMGPTGFCPATHGILPKGQRSATAKALQEWYFLPGMRCSEEPALSYANAVSFGETTIYDATTLHRGTANTAGIPRPILMLTYAADEAAIEARGYKTWRFEGDKQAQ